MRQGNTRDNGIYFREATTLAAGDTAGDMADMRWPSLELCRREPVRGIEGLEVH